MKGMSNIFESFKITYQGKAYWVCAKEIPGWTSDFDEHNDEDSDSDDEQFKGVFKEDIDGSDEEVQGENDVSVVPDTVVEETNPKSIDGDGSSDQIEKQSADPFNIYSLLNNNKLKENKESNTNESLKYPPGFTPSEDVEANGGSLLTVMEELIKVGQTMGYNMEGCTKNIEEIIESQGVDGILRCGILCVWDPNSFKKLNTMISDYFVMIRGNWVNNGKLLLIISVYAPQEFSEKKLPWDYLGQVIANWKEEIPLGGCSFTWCHRSASKMSKLDRFLMSESLLRECPNFSAITLDRYLSDHHLILLRELAHDYGPIPFRFFHYWLEVEGFENFVNEVWHEAPMVMSNAMINLMNKLKYLKNKIRVWNGDVSADFMYKRMEFVKSIQEMDKLNAMEATQKAKIKWAIEVRPILNMVFPHQLNSTQKLDLEVEVSKEEIKKAVLDCGIDKSLGPNGFIFGFYRRFWDLIEQDVVSAVKCFFQAGQFGILLVMIKFPGVIRPLVAVNVIFCRPIPKEVNKSFLASLFPDDSLDAEGFILIKLRAEWEGRVACSQDSNLGMRLLGKMAASAFEYGRWVKFVEDICSSCVILPKISFRNDLRLWNVNLLGSVFVSIEFGLLGLILLGCLVKSIKGLYAAKGLFGVVVEGLSG
ncbi:RNA-directed DNA polymerase, eukaryota [Tanacetum coccineum]|uniref:RNA-directed DNA polymerase, eukaryota n=1 Tax=Tanacetum coccineum TaxID=301880 RepID=A0ABQ5DSL1_9ASTR